MQNKLRSTFRPASHALALEPRLLFDGAGAVAAADHLNFDLAADSHVEAQKQETVPVVDVRPGEAIEKLASDKTLVIIDARVPDYQSIFDQLPADAIMRVVDVHESGLDTISAELAQGQFDAVHIFSHGTPGSFVIGTDTLNNDTLTSHIAALSAWATHLTAEADILLYGCDIAQGETGQLFINEVARLTSADISASTNATGAAAKGGDWVLERQTGRIETLALGLTGYDGLLAATAINDADSATSRVTPEDAALTINGITVAGGASDIITLRIQTTGGTSNLTLGSTTLDSGSLNSADFAITGTITDVNVALTTLSYTPAADQNSSVGGFTPKVELSVTAGGAGNLSITNISVTALNDAPDLSTQTALVVTEGGNNTFTLTQLASSANALDVDIATGQQVIGQQMVIITSLPGKGTLSYQGGAVAVGQVIPATSLGNLKYTHNGTDLIANDNDSFNITVSDGGGAQTTGSIGITITPANVAPSISGNPSIIEGQVKVVAPSITLGDAFDTLANSTITIDNVVTGSQGTLFFDANNNNVVDTGEEIIVSRTLNATEAANLLTQLKFAHNGAEPNAPGATAPSYRMAVTDAGGGTGTPSAAVQATLTIDVSPNNDDPVLGTNLHASSGTALSVNERTSGTPVVLTSTMLQITDQDRNPADINTTTPAHQLVYTIGTRPTQGELQLNVGGGLGYGSDGWITLGDGGRFTQADIDAGKVRYYQTTNVTADTADIFTFTVRDSAFGYDVWTDPASPTGGREGGARDTPTGPIKTQEFHFNIKADVSTNHDTYEGGPRPATPGYGGSNMSYTFAPGTMSNGNGAATWNEANVAAGGGYVIDSGMLKYTITRTDNMGTPGNSGDDISITVPENETVYTLTAQPLNGMVQRFVGGNWVNIPTNGQFTQADITANNIRFVHDGSEDHVASFSYRVSDGTPNHHAGTFSIDTTPTNDRPTASGSSLAQVTEGNTNTVRLGTSQLGMNDADLSLDASKQTGEGAADFLWFQVAAQPVDGGSVVRGTLERWDGSAWVTVTPGQWLPSTLLAATADGGTSGLRYVHDGSEPLAYTGGPKVSFSYTVRDDLANPNDAFAINATPPGITDGSAQANESATATVTVNIIPVNDAPQVADKPGDAEPTIAATIASGGALTGVNEILSGVLEGSTHTITSAYLTAIDRDNTTEQRQYRITSTPTQGSLLLNGAALGVGSTFTQKDIDDNKVSYRHKGTETNASITDSLGTYNDKFHFVVNDGVQEDSGEAAQKNVFLITLASTNDKPTVTGPSGPITIDSTTPANNPVTGFSVDDVDSLAGAGTADFLQVTVRLQASDGTPFTDYSNVSFGYTAQSGGDWFVSKTGSNDILQFQGSKTQVNDALLGLTVTFADDRDAFYKLEVIVDDRMRDGSGNLLTTGIDANGGEQNQNPTVGGAPIAVDGTAYNWATTATVPAGSGNIVSTTVDLRASSVNDVPTFTAPANFTVNEDVRSKVGDNGNKFAVEDAESTAFGTPVSVTVSVPSGTLHIGATGTGGSKTPAGGQAVTISGQGSGSITLTGRADDIEAVLNGRNFADNADDTNTGLYYTSASNVNHDVNGGGAGDGDVTLTLAFNEGSSAIGGDVGSGSVANTVANITTALTITAINDAPTVTAGSGTITVGSTVATAVPGFVVNDVDANDGYADGETDGVIQVTVRVVASDGTPLPQATGSNGGKNYTDLNISLDTTASGHGATVDGTLNGSNQALELRGTRDQINAYLVGLQVTFANLSGSNVDATYKIEVIADDRLRDAGTGALTANANGGANNQQTNLPTVLNTDTFAPYTTAVSGYLYNVASNTRDLFISSINDPGNITASDVTVNEGSATLVLNADNANITLADPDDNGASTMEVTVTVGKGKITTVGGAGGTVSGLNSSTITISGATEAQINSRLQALTITYPGANATEQADWNGSFDVTITYNDKGNTGTRPSDLTGANDNALDDSAARSNNGDYYYADGSSNHLVTTRIITVTVNGVNDAPTRTTATVTLPAGTEDTDGGSGDTVSDLFDSSFSDAKDGVTDGSFANSFAGIAITTNNAIAGQGKWQYSTDNGNTWTDLPFVSDNSAFLLDTNAKLRFDPANNFHGTPGGLAVRLVDDSSGSVTNGSTANVSGANSGGSTRYSNSSNTVTLGTTVVNVNDRPTATNTLLTNTHEDNTNPAGATVAALGFGYADTTDNQTAITGGGNAATAFGGIAIVGNAANSSTEGVWQYDSGSGWVTIGSGGSAPADGTALILPTTASLRFVPVADYNGTPGSLTVRVADSVQGFNANTDISATVGNQTSTWSPTKTLGTTVDPRNDAPAFSNTASNPTAVEDGSVGGATGWVKLLNTGSNTVSDLDLSTTAALNSTIFGAGSVTVSLTSGITGDTLRLNTLVAGANGISSISGGTNGAALVVSFTNAATLAQVQAVLEAIEYRHNGDDPTNILSGSARSTLAYSVVLSDGNNAQAGSDAGGPNPLTASVNGSITLTPANDPPVATNNTNSVTEDAGTPVTGNVKTDGTADSDPDTLVADLALTQIVGNTTEAIAAGSTSASNATTVVGKYGTLTIGADGSYSYALDNSNPTVNALNAGDTLTDEVFTYTLSDGSGTDTATLTITINGTTDGAPTIAPVDGNAAATGEATVHESGLAGGSEAATSKETTTGSITVTAPDGIKSITVGGTTFTIVNLDALTVANPSAVINTGEGELRITGITNKVGPVGAPTSAEVSYTYTLKTAQSQPGATESTDTVALVVTDASATPKTANGTLTVQIVDDVPAAVADTGNVKATETLTVTAASGVLNNDASGADGWAAGGGVVGVVVGNSIGTPSAANVGSQITGTYGKLTLNANGSYSYVAHTAAAGAPPTTTDVFTYTVRDADGDETTQILTITILNNQPPVANDDTRSTPEDTPVSGNVIFGSGGDVADTDPDTDPLTVTQIVIAGVTTTVPADGSRITVTIPGKGSLSIDKTGSYTFTPVADWHGSVPDITYTLDDGKGASNSTASATLNITVTPVADITDDTASTQVNQSVTTPVLGNDSFEGTPSVTATTPPAHGTLTLNSDNTITYTPNPGFTGTDSYTYTVTSGGVTETATVTVTVANTPPVANNDTRSTPEDTPVSGNVMSGSNGDVADRDPDSDPLTLTGFSVAGNSYTPGSTAHIAGVGSITLNADGSYTFTPVADWHGTVPPITYTVSDGTGAANQSASATLNITVTPVADITDDTASTQVNQPVTTPVLGNDSFEGTPSVTATTPPAHGTLTLNSDNTITYTPNPGFTGTDSYTYTVTSGGVTETATVTVTVANTPPVANNDTRSTPEDTPVSGNVMSGSNGDVADRDPDSDPLTLTGFSVAGNSYTPGSTAHIAGVGSITLNADGSYTFTPVADWNGTVPPITYTVSDGTGAANQSASATLNITVTPVADITDDTASTQVNQSVTTPVLGNDSFEGTPSVTATTPPAHGTLTLNSDNTITYTPNPGFTGTDSYTYTVTSGGVTETATVTIVVPVENPPTQTIPQTFPQTLPGNPAYTPPVLIDQMLLSGGSPSLTLNSPVIVDSGPYFANERSDNVRRMNLPFHPIVYVNRAVNVAQDMRIWDDQRSFSNPAMFNSDTSVLESLGAELGMDPNVFVSHAVRDSHRGAQFLSHSIAARYSRIDLSSDNYLTRPGLFGDEDLEFAVELQPNLPDTPSQVLQDQPPTTEHTSGQTVTDAAFAPPANARHAAAPTTPSFTAQSFTEQLRSGARHLPASAHRA